MNLGVDYFATQPEANVVCLHLHGYTFVARYYDNSGGTSAKCLDKAEVQTLLGAGMGIVPVFETTGGDSNFAPSGYDYFTTAQGSWDGGMAVLCARNAGQPTGTTIYTAIDFDCQDPDRLLGYVNAFHAIMVGSGFSTGIYAGRRVIEHAKANWPAVTRTWQTLAWSQGVIVPGIDLYQRPNQNGSSQCGVSVDENESYTAIEWAPEDEMALTPQEIYDAIAPLLQEKIVAPQADTNAAIKDAIAALSQNAAGGMSDADLAVLLTKLGVILEKAGADVATPNP
jgi:hypothetical protein